MTHLQLLAAHHLHLHPLEGQTPTTDAISAAHPRHRHTDAHTPADRPRWRERGKSAGTSLCACLYTHNIHKKAGPFPVARLKMDPPFQNRLAPKGEKCQPSLARPPPQARRTT